MSVLALYPPASFQNSKRSMPCLFPTLFLLLQKMCHTNLWCFVVLFENHKRHTKKRKDGEHMSVDLTSGSQFRKCSRTSIHVESSVGASYPKSQPTPLHVCLFLWLGLPEMIIGEVHGSSCFLRSKTQNAPNAKKWLLLPLLFSPARSVPKKNTASVDAMASPPPPARGTRAWKSARMNNLFRKFEERLLDVWHL
jgi:hypothetical protein